MIVCISGWKKNGKDMLAEYLINNYSATRVSFADPLKDMVAEEYGVDRASLDDQDRKECPLLDMPVNPQDSYSRMISEFLFKEFRLKSGLQPTTFTYNNGHFQGVINSAFSEDPNHTITETAYWTPRALAILKGSTNRSVRSNYWVQKAIEKIRNTQEMVVISDLRYKSEMNQIKEAFGDDAVFIRVQRFETSPSTDPSERDLDDANFDYYIDNTGTKEESCGQLERALADKFEI